MSNLLWIHLFRFIDASPDESCLNDLLNSSSSSVQVLINSRPSLYPRKRYSELYLIISLPRSFYYSLYGLLKGLALKSLDFDSHDILYCYKEAFRLNPNRFDISFNLANAYLVLNDPLCASFYLHSLKLNPYNSACWYNYSQFLLDNLHFQEAKSELKIAILLSPNNAEQYSLLGLCLSSHGTYASSERSYLLALSLDNQLSSAHTNLGSLLVSSRRLPEALNSFENAVKTSSNDEDSSSALFTLGLCHLVLGRFDNGWSLYRHRFSTNLFSKESLPTVGVLIDSMESLCSFNDNQIVVWAEQGFGDCIQFSRYLLFLCEMNVDFEFQCHSSLIPLIKNWLPGHFPVTELSSIRRLSDSRPHLPLLNCPHIFATELHSIPSQLPYFTSPYDKFPDEFRVLEPPGGLSVGIVWSSNPSNKSMYANKCIPLDALFPVLSSLVSLDLINLHSLQMGPDAICIQPYILPDRVFDWSTLIDDFSDTAT